MKVVEQMMTKKIPLCRQFLRVCVLACLVVMPVSAEWVQVTGSAYVENGLYDEARSRARHDALQKAVMKFGASVSSEQEVRQGELIKDYVNVSANAKVRRSEIQEEYLSDGNMHVVMNVQLEQVQQCPGSQSSGYRKAVAVMGFSLQSPDQAALGGLHGVDRGLANSLHQALQKQNGLILFNTSNTQLYQDTVSAPTLYTQERQLSNAAEFAKQLGAQFVISGVVRDMSVENESAFGSSRWASFLRAGNLSNTRRNFSVEVFVHDGFSGSIIWRKTFTAQADWNLDPQTSVGFGSAEFWNETYGHEVQKLVNTMAYLIDEQLKCQPFMTRISRVDGKTLHFNAGASTGIRPGDTFSLYRTFSFYDAQHASGAELQNVKTALTVSQVHPEFGSGTIAIEPGRINIQEDDVLIAW